LALPAFFRPHAGGATATKFECLHSWDLTTEAAVALQRDLAKQIDVRVPLTRCDLIAGADISYNRFSSRFYAAVIVMRTDDCSVVEVQHAVRESPFPYVPGLLTFREGPALLDAFAKVESQVDAVMFDGQGIAHPRRLGLASHMGLWLKVPSIGCAKSLLTGHYKEPAEKAGSVAPLLDRKEVLGEAVRTKDRTNPVYVSAGHLIDLPSSVRLVLQTCRGYRLPEPTRQAHQAVNEIRRQDGGGKGQGELPLE
jgi:deoxyribonuclease V